MDFVDKEMETLSDASSDDEFFDCESGEDDEEHVHHKESVGEGEERIGHLVSDDEDLGRISGAQLEAVGQKDEDDKNEDGRDGNDPEENLFPDHEKSTERALEMKEDANSLFREKRFDEAFSKYTESLHWCSKDTDLSLAAILFSNRGACALQLEDWDQAMKDCTKAIMCDENYVKAYFRRAEAYEKKEMYDAAIKDLVWLAEHSPSPEWRARIIRLEEIHKKKQEEMLDQLKELGKSFLSKLGIDPSAFKMAKDPTTGNISIQTGSGKK
eukprot:TRINITY_DN1931_c0_g1_i2.p2 TRINITY_DN1931_c0_g1~~TRINITY_DN1931_c0_g1_i2.p2  ORF type:complete len:270 (-),score=114.74 TRINITY_DN1931_c0_g1_i2:98-907(-)